MTIEVSLPSLADSEAFASRMAARLRAGDLVLLSGDLGAGKTTFVRAVLQALGFLGAVRSPTFNLIQTFDTQPPVMHADLYRLQGAAGTGIEEYFDSHLCLIEWPDRLGDLIDPETCLRIHFEFAGEGRCAQVDYPAHLAHLHEVE